jgi:hypothetical protein
MLREQWRRGRDEAGEKRRGEGLTCDGSLAELLEATGNGAGGAAGGLRWPTVALSLCFSFSSLLLLLLLLFLLVFPLYSALSLIFSFYLFALSPPVFIGKKQGRKRTGRPLCCRSSNMWKVLGK